MSCGSRRRKRMIPSRRAPTMITRPMTSRALANSEPTTEVCATTTWPSASAKRTMKNSGRLPSVDCRTPVTAGPKRDADLLGREGDDRGERRERDPGHHEGQHAGGARVAQQAGGGGGEHAHDHRHTPEARERRHPGVLPPGWAIAVAVTAVTGQEAAPVAAKPPGDGRAPRTEDPRQEPAGAVGRDQRPRRPDPPPGRVRGHLHHPVRARDRRRLGGRPRTRHGGARARRVGDEGHADGRAGRRPGGRRRARRGGSARGGAGRGGRPGRPWRGRSMSRWSPRPARARGRRGARGRREARGRGRTRGGPGRHPPRPVGPARGALAAAAQQQPSRPSAQQGAGRTEPPKAHEPPAQRPPRAERRREAPPQPAAGRPPGPGAADPDRTAAILVEVLDDLGAARHRPFSRMG